jgi:hypothetical protein
MIRCPLSRAALFAAASFAMVLACTGPAAAQVNERVVIRELAPMMFDQNFDKEIDDYADEHDLDPDVVRNVMTRYRMYGMPTQRVEPDPRTQRRNPLDPRMPSQQRAPDDD